MDNADMRIIMIHQMTELESRAKLRLTDQTERPSSSPSWKLSYRNPVSFDHLCILSSSADSLFRFPITAGEGHCSRFPVILNLPRASPPTSRTIFSSTGL